MYQAFGEGKSIFLKFLDEHGITQKKKDSFEGYIHYLISSKRVGRSLLYIQCLAECTAHGRNSINIVAFRSFELIKSVYVLIKTLLTVSQKIYT